MKVESLKPEHHGKQFKSLIGQTSVEGKIYYDKSENQFYLCQNERDGSDCVDKLGYKFS